MVSMEWPQSYKAVYELEKMKADQWNNSGEGKRFWALKKAQEERTEKVSSLNLSQTSSIIDVWLRGVEIGINSNALDELESLIIESTRQEWNFPEAKVTFSRMKKIIICVGNDLILDFQGGVH